MQRTMSKYLLPWCHAADPPGGWGMRSNNPCNPKRRTFLKNRCKDGTTLLLSCYETDKICRFQISDFKFQIVSRRLRGWTQIMARGRRAMPYAECHKAVGLERFLSLFPFSLSPFCLFPFAFSKHTFSPSWAEVLLPTVRKISAHVRENICSRPEKDILPAHPMYQSETWNLKSLITC